MNSSDKNIVYKYISVNGLERICKENPTLRFTPIFEFNDPFEGINFIGTFIKSCIININPESEKDLRSIAEKCGVDMGRFIEGSKQKGRRQFSSLMPQGNSCVRFDSLCESYYEDIGVLCTSTSYDSICMWAHYASNHSGIVIGLDTNHHYFKQLKNPYGLIDGFNSVEYVKDIPRECYEKYVKDGKIVFYEVLSQLLLYKYSEWKYENEKRLIVHIPSLCTKREEQDKKNENNKGVVPLDINAIKKIFLGRNIDLKNENIVTNFCIKNDIECFRMKTSQYEYKLNAEPVTTRGE